MQELIVNAVISFCSNDWRFLQRCVEGVMSACPQVIVTVCDHFFDGSEENYALLEEAFRRFPQCQFLVFEFYGQESYRPFSPLGPEHCDWRHEWHNTGRWLGFLYAGEDVEGFLFLDCDEIVDAARLSDWLRTSEAKELAACRFACYVHFREAQYEAVKQDDFSLFARRESLCSDFFWDEHERFGLFHRIEGLKKLGVRGKDELPMIRHYSGVRTVEEMRKKLNCWGHHWERDWESLLKEEYSRPFSGTDFVRRYAYRTISVSFDPLQEKIPQLPERSLQDFREGLHRFPNVAMVSRQEAFRKDLLKCL